MTSANTPSSVVGALYLATINHTVITVRALNEYESGLWLVESISTGRQCRIHPARLERLPFHDSDPKYAIPKLNRVALAANGPVAKRIIKGTCYADLIPMCVELEILEDAWLDPPKYGLNKGNAVRLMQDAIVRYFHQYKPRPTVKPKTQTQDGGTTK